MARLKKILKKLFKPRRRITPVYLNRTQNNILKDRCILITGGSSGIGYAIAELFAQNGAIVIITGRNEDKLENARIQLHKTAGTSVFSFALNNESTDLFEESIIKIEKMVGRKIDTLINNAGISSKTSFLNMDEKDFDDVISINLKSTIFLSQAFARYLIKNNIEGNILNIGSSSGIRPANNPYMISKWGIRGFTLGIAKQLIKYGIVVNGIAPGPTATQMLCKDKDNLYGASNDSGRLVSVVEIASLALQLVSMNGRMIIGEMVNINGGSGTLTFDDIEY